MNELFGIMVPLLALAMPIIIVAMICGTIILVVKMLTTKSSDPKEPPIQ